MFTPFTVPVENVLTIKPGACRSEVIMVHVAFVVCALPLARSRPRKIFVGPMASGSRMARTASLGAMRFSEG